MRAPRALILFLFLGLSTGCAKACGGAAADADAVARDATAGADAADAADAAPEGVDAASPAHAGDDAWVKKLPRDKAFTAVDLAGDADAASPLRVEWRVYPRRLVKELPEKDHPRRLELLLTRGELKRAVAIGEHPGAPVATSLTTCRRQGYLPGTGATWQIPALFNVVSTFSMATTQSGDDFVLLMGHDVLRLLHRRTSDGACGEMIFQGPLQTCPDAKWSLLADIAVKGEPIMTEGVLEVDAKGLAKPFDCSNGPGLLPPPKP